MVAHSLARSVRLYIPPKTPTFVCTMRICPILLLFSPVLLLAGCNPEPNPGPRIDLVGSTAPPLLSSNRLSTVPADTFTTRVYAEARDGGPVLTRLRIVVDYIPLRNPFEYPTPITNFNPKDGPKDLQFVYLDSVLAPGTRAIAFQFRAVTRSTSGSERWEFQVEDEENRSNKRGYQLTLRNIDSLLVFHRYTLRLQAPTNRGARSFASLSSGLALPAFSLGSRSAENRELIDLVYAPITGQRPGLASPNDPLLPLTGWATRRATELRRTTINPTDFAGIDTQAEIQAAFDNGVVFPSATRTGTLTQNQVVAFRTIDRKVGVMLVESFPTAPTAAIQMQVRVTK